MLTFFNSYINLGEQFFHRVEPEKVTSPILLLWNENLAKQLSFPEDFQQSSPKEKSLLAQYFSGCKILSGAVPIALAYSGHQFGHFNPQLGDGRAHLLGEVIDQHNIRCDIQLKGSGKTAFSRRGDGKCALAPALREYILSEAMFALGVPTSRCLAVVSTGETINRGLTKVGAVVTRVATSHIRVGSFQYFAARGDLTSLKSLVDYSIERHFPELNSLELNSIELNSIKINNESSLEEQRILAFLGKVIDKQIILIIEWLRVGFIHGVMNTDNTAICGETIDFGPCAMLGAYHENAVFSSIDEYGRYAFANQGKIAQWNMARLADCLLPLLTKTQTKEKEETTAETENKEQLVLGKVEALIIDFTAKFDEAYYAMYAAKLGLVEVNDDNKQLIKNLLSLMQDKALDYTLTFAYLTDFISTDVNVLESHLHTDLEEWLECWQIALKNSSLSLTEVNALMQRNNPVVIPRNHHVEAVLAHCEQAFADSNDFKEEVAEGSAEGSVNKQGSVEQQAFDKINSIVAEFLTVLRSPYQTLPATKNYQDAPEDGDKYYRTFCGT